MIVKKFSSAASVAQISLCAAHCCFMMRPHERQQDDYAVVGNTKQRGAKSIVVFSSIRQHRNRILSRIISFIADQYGMYTAGQRMMYNSSSSGGNSQCISMAHMYVYEEEHVRRQEGGSREGGQGKEVKISRPHLMVDLTRGSSDASESRNVLFRRVSCRDAILPFLLFLFRHRYQFYHKRKGGLWGKNKKKSQYLATIA